VSAPAAPAALDPTWRAQLAAQAADLALRLVASAVVLLVLGGLYWLTRRAVRRALARAGAHANARLLVDRCVQFGFLFVAVTWELSVLGVPLTAFVAVVGAISLAVSLALQDVLKNLVAGLIILVERPFTIGEHIDFKTFSGVVETIELRTTVLRTPTGQRVVIPNAMIFSDTLVNRSAYGRQLVRLRVVVPLDAPAGDAGGKDAGDAAPADGAGVAGEVLRTIRSVEPGGGARPAEESPRPSVLVEVLTREKATLRVEAWTGDAKDAVPRLAWALRRRIPGAEITVLE
jgi:small-conductance mechanosensitive channel